MQVGHLGKSYLIQRVHSPLPRHWKKNKIKWKKKKKK